MGPVTRQASIRVSLCEAVRLASGGEGRSEGGGEGGACVVHCFSFLQALSVSGIRRYQQVAREAESLIFSLCTAGNGWTYSTVTAVQGW